MFKLLVLLFTINCIFILQKRVLTLIDFKDCSAHVAPLFFKSKIVKLPEKIEIENCHFIIKYINNKLPPMFNGWFIFSSTYYNYETSWATKGHLKIPTVTIGPHCLVCIYFCHGIKDFFCGC